jgi:hypothetical protein
MDLQRLREITTQYEAELRMLIALSGPSGHKATPGITMKEWSALDEDRFIQLLTSHKITSLILPRLAPYKDQIPENLYQRIKATSKQQAGRALAQIEQTIRLQRLFKDHGIPLLVFKGNVLSQMVYGDPSLKNSKDIDLLIPLSHAPKATDILQEEGYRMTYPHIPLSSKQRKANYTISHHYGFYHPAKRVHLELHWNLTNPGSLLPLDFEGLYQRSVQVRLNQHPVQTPGHVDHLIFLAVHGSIHQWCRLNWLWDFTGFLELTGSEEQEQARERMQRLGLEKCLQQACLTSHLLYGIPADEKKLQTHRLSHRFAAKPLQAIRDTRPAEAADKLKDLPYRLSMRGSWRYKFHLIFRLRTHHTNWAAVRLPDYLFFLYYPLRPLLWLKEVFKKR